MSGSFCYLEDVYERRKSKELFSTKEMANNIEELKFCSNCEKKISAKVTSCPYCGQAQEGIWTGKPVSKKEYIEQEHPSLKKDIRNISIFCYVCVGISVLIASIGGNSGYIDALVLLGLTLGMHLGMSKVCAILLLIFCCLEFVVSLAFMGSPSGFYLVIAGIMAVKTFVNIDKQYKNYVSEHGNT